MCWGVCRCVCLRTEKRVSPFFPSAADGRQAYPKRVGAGATADPAENHHEPGQGKPRGEDQTIERPGSGGVGDETRLGHQTKTGKP